MRNLKKRLVSFVSALAMTLTMLPSVSLFASAADTVLNFNKSTGDFTYTAGDVKTDFGADTPSNFDKGSTATSKTSVSVSAGDKLTLKFFVQGEEARVYSMPKVAIGGTEVGQFKGFKITDKDRDTYDESTCDTATVSSGHKWTVTTSITSSANASGTLVLTFDDDKKDKVGYTSLTISSDGGSTGGDESSEVESSSTPDSSSEAESGNTGSYVEYNGSFDLDNWNGILNLDLTKYTSISKITITMAGSGQVQFNYSGSTNVSAGDNDFTDVSSFAGKTVPIKGTGTITKITVTGTKTGESEESSTPDPTTYTVTAIAGTGGSVSPATQQVEPNGQATVTATADDGYEFVNWTNEEGTSVSDVAEYAFTVTGDVTLTANFKAIGETESWELITSYDGTFTPSYGTTNYLEYDLTNYSKAKIVIEGTVNGAKLWLEEEGKGGNDVIGGSDISGTYEYVFTAADMATVKAILQGNDGNVTGFKIYGVKLAGESFTVNAASADDKKGSVNPTTQSVISGNNATVQAIPAPGYRFEKWTDANGTTLSTNAKYTFRVTEDVNLTANFAELVAGTGFRVEGTKIIDANGNEFIMRGVNIAHAWLHPGYSTKPYEYDTFESIRGAASLGSNTVRIALSDGTDREGFGEDWIKTPPEMVEQIIAACEENKLVCVLEVHDPTGSTNTGKIDSAVDYWKEIADIMNAHQDTVILNIANEWNGDFNYYGTAIENLRNAGIQNMIMLDADEWGQGAGTLANNAASVASHDQLSNTVFALHIYETAGGDAGKVQNSIDTCISMGLPFIVGEFGTENNGNNVDEDTVMSYCTEKNIGYLAWSWIGNDGSGKPLDLVSKNDGSQLSSWGTKFFNSIKGAEICSVFGPVTNYTVTPTVKTGCETMGTVSDPVTVREGLYATVTATPNTNYRFVRWEDADGNKLSTSPNYRFKVTDNVALTAVFSEPDKFVEVTIPVIPDGTKVQFDGWGSQSFSVNIPEGSVDHKLYVEYYGNAGDEWFKAELNAAGLTGDLEEGRWVQNAVGSSYWEGDPLTKNSSITPEYGTNIVTLGVQKGKYTKAYITCKIPLDNFTEQPDIRVNNEEYGSVTEAIGDGTHTYYVGETVQAKANAGYLFVNWTILTIVDGVEKIVPISQEFPEISDTKKALTLTEEMGGRIIYANFGEKTPVIYEAEDFTDFISETKYSSAALSADPESGEKYKYDDPTDVLQGNTNSLTQTWNSTSYSDLNIAPLYSAGGAVALTGPSNGVAIPFSIQNDLSDDLEIELGYNYGTLFEQYENDSASWANGGLFVNIYYVGDEYDKFATLVGAATPSLSRSDYATPESASDLLKSNGTLAGNAYSVKLPLNANGDDVDEATARATQQVTTVVLPAGLPAGHYFISVATDTNNCTEWESYNYNSYHNIMNYNGDGYNEDRVLGGSEDNSTNVGTAYYDYIKFYTASTPDKPSSIIVGVKFIFTDMFGNNLMSNDFSHATYDKDNNQIKFSPKVPRFLSVQGYTLTGWELLDPNDPTGKTVLKKYEGSDATGLALQLEELQFLAGSVITFRAQYEIPDDPYDMTVQDGTVYVMADESDTDFTYKLDRGESYKVANYQKVKLVALDTIASKGRFQYWTLNGHIYSYDSVIFFTAWCDANFVAVYDDGEPAVTPAAFINDEVQTFGFETTNVLYHKITFDCAFYIPDTVDFVSCGIIFTPTQANIEDLSGVTISGLTLGNLPTKTAVATARRDQLYAEANNQVLMSLTGMKNGVSRYARAFFIYNEGGVDKVVFSDRIAGVTTPLATN